MPGRRMNTRVIKEVLRLKSLSFSIREISRSVNRARSSVHDMVGRAEDAGLRWPLPEDIDDEKLGRLLYPEPVEVRGSKVVPEWAHIHRELKRLGVTRICSGKSTRHGIPTAITATRAFASSTMSGAKTTPGPP